MSTNQSMCQEVEDRLAEVLDGTAEARILQHVASCDACRDLRYEGFQVSTHVGASGLDFRPADDFIEKLTASLAAARPQDHAPSSLGAAPVASARVPASSTPRDTTPSHDGAASGPKPRAPAEPSPA